MPNLCNQHSIMKKIIKFSILFLIISIVGYLSYKISTKLHYKSEVAQNTKHLTQFSFPTTKGNIYTQEQLRDKDYTIFVYFNSECEHCQYEAKQISENLLEFQKAQLLFISFEPMDKIKTFALQYHLDGKEKVTFLQDAKGDFSEKFDVNGIPYILIYNPNRDLVQKYKGEVKIEALLKHLK